MPGVSDCAGFAGANRGAEGVSFTTARCQVSQVDQKVDSPCVFGRTLHPNQLLNFIPDSLLTLRQLIEISGPLLSVFLRLSRLLGGLAFPGPSSPLLLTLF